MAVSYKLSFMGNYWSCNYHNLHPYVILKGEEASKEKK